MFDSQMANQLSKGKGLGLADMLVRQLMQSGRGAGGRGESRGGRSGAGRRQAGPLTMPTASTGKAFSPANRADFIDAIKPAAERAAAQLGRGRRHA